eukprot:TRINITY_DN3455_c0_g1_i1.p1 TRINITY_DN3455_c0_g1~~TRINITY_DN3455_c0_g1_i1.p1  ORF type:complete len:1630 (-),score=312.73 TRINITY_DN3455_c0_g1_i1:49-4482(-)
MTYLFSLLEPSYDPSEISVFDNISILEHGVQSITPVVLNQMNHGDSNLSAMSLKLAQRLTRGVSEEAELIKAIQSVQILSKNSQINSYNNMSNLMIQIGHYMDLSVLKPEMVDNLEECINECTNYIYEIDRTEIGQKMLFNMGMHELITDLIQHPLNTNDDDAIRRILTCSYEFLLGFAMDNPFNQSVLYEYIPFQIQQMVKNRFLHGIPEVITGAIIEVYKNNTKLCSEIKDSELAPFIAMTYDKKSPIFLEFFMTIIKPNDLILKNNQNRVLNLLTSFPETKHILAQDAMENDDLDDYRVSLIQLMALCAEGKNYYTEVACQKILSIEECLLVCYRRDNDSIISAYAFFIDEVYLNTENSVQVLPSVLFLQFNKLLWELFQKFYDSTIRMLEHESDREVDYTFRFYIYEVIVPFYHHFYSNKNFLFDKASKEQKELSNMILDSLFLLRQRCSRDKHVQSSVTSCMKVIHANGVTGLDYLSSIDKLLKSAVVSPDYMEEMKRRFPKEYERNKNRMNTNESIPPAIKEKNRDITRRVYEKMMDFMCSEYMYEDNEYDEEILGESDYMKILASELESATDEKYLISILNLIREYVNVDYENEMAESIKMKRQNTLAELEIPIYVTNLIHHSNEKISHKALKLLGEMMAVDPLGKEVNEAIVYNLLNTFTSRGSETFFLDTIKFIESAKDHIRDFKHSLSTRDIVDYHPSLDNHQEDPVLILEEHIFDLFVVFERMARFPMFKTLLIDKQWDLIKEFVLFLKAFESLISMENSHLAIQLFSTLKEIVTQSPVNQASALSAQVIHPVNRILLDKSHAFKSYLGIDTDLEDASILLNTAGVDFILALTEDTENWIVQEVTNQLTPKALETNTYLLVKDHLTSPSSEAVTLASLSFRLIKHLADNDTGQQNQALQESLDICIENTSARIGRIEVISKNNDLERIYFPIPENYRRHTLKRESGYRDIIPCFKRGYTDVKEVNEQAERDLIRNMDNAILSDDINWSKAGEKIDSFIAWAERQLLKKEQEDKYEKNKIIYFLIHKWDTFWYICLLLSLAINIYLLTPQENFRDWETDIPMKVLSILHTIFAFILGITFYYKKGVYINSFAWIRKLASKSKKSYMLYTWDQIRDNKLTPVTGTTFPTLVYYLISLQNVLKSGKAMFYFLYFVFSLLGTILSPLFFSLHLFQILVKSNHAQSILKALRLNVARLALMLVIIGKITYIFAIVGYVYFKDQYDYTDGKDCRYLFSCLLTNFYYGVPSQGALVEHTRPFVIDPWGHVDMFYGVGWIMFVVLFYLVMGVVLLNVVFAIIVDTFGQLREKRNESKEELNSNCYICSLDRDSFQRAAKDFNEHTDNDHNRLHYLYFFAYMKELNVNNELQQLSLLEKEIRKKIKAKKFLKFFPISRAMVLEDTINEVDDIIKGRLLSIDERMLNSQELEEKLVKQTSEGNQYLQSLLEEVEAVQTELQDLRDDFNEEILEMHL